MEKAALLLLIAEGITKRDAARNAQKRGGKLSLVKHSAQQAKEILGASSLTIENFNDNRSDLIDLLEIIKLMERNLREIEPEIVYSHHAGDRNADHRVVHGAVSVACRSLPGSPIKTLLFFEISSSTEWQLSGTSYCFCQNWFIDISQTVNRKLNARECYSSELHPWPHPRTLKVIRHLAF